MIKQREFMMIHELKNEGLSISEIARRSKSPRLGGMVNHSRINGFSHVSERTNSLSDIILSSQSPRNRGFPSVSSFTFHVSSSYAFGLPQRSKRSIFASTASSTPTPWAFEIAIRIANALRKRFIRRGLPDI